MEERHIGLRPVLQSDESFLRSLYSSVRSPEMVLLPWSNEQKTDFIDTQFDAQTSHYRTHYPNASFDIIEIDGISVGRITIDRRENEILLVDMALMPELRQKSVGTELLTPLIRESETIGKKITLHVEVFNRAQRLYSRLGFVVTATDSIYYAMERLPKSFSSTQVSPESR